MQLIQLIRLQKAHDQNRQLMRFVMMPSLSCARAAIVMFQTVYSRSPKNPALQLLQNSSKSPSAGS